MPGEGSKTCGYERMRLATAIAAVALGQGSGSGSSTQQPTTRVPAYLAASTGESEEVTGCITAARYGIDLLGYVAMPNIQSYYITNVSSRPSLVFQQCHTRLPVGMICHPLCPFELPCRNSRNTQPIV